MKSEKNPLVKSMPELNRRVMGLFQIAEAEATTVRGALDATQIANTSGKLASTAVKLANNRREKVDGEWLEFMDPEKVQKQHQQVEAEQQKVSLQKEKAEPEEASPEVQAAIEKSRAAKLLEQAAKAEDKARRLREAATTA